MASTYSPLLGIELIASGEQANTWGYTTNNNLGTLIEQAIAGQADIVMTTTSHTLTDIDGASDEARCMILNVSGVLASTGTLICPTSAKVYVIANNTSGGQDIELRTSGGTGVIVPAGTSKQVFCDGVDVYESVTAIDTLLLGGNPTEDLQAVPRQYVDNNFLSLGGGTMTGPITLPGVPTTNLEAAPKIYVDQMVPLAGNATMTGPLYIPATTPSSATQVVNKGYVDSATASAVSNYVPLTRTISTGTGLTGGGDLSTNRTLSLATTGVTPTSYTSANITVDAYGRITAAQNGGGAGVTSVTATYPLSSSGGSAPDISFVGTLSVANGGTGSSTTSGALASLGALSTTGTAYDSSRLGGVTAASYVTSSSGTAYNASNLGGVPASSYVTSSSGTAYNASNLGGYPASSYLTSGGSPTFSNLSVSGTIGAGTIVCSGNITAYYSSDERLKEDIAPIQDPIKKIRQLRGCDFNWSQDYIDREGGEDGFFVRKKDVGLIAQQVLSVLPEAVAEKPDGYLGVQYDKVIPLLVEAVNAILDKLGVDDDA